MPRLFRPVSVTLAAIRRRYGRRLRVNPKAPKGYTVAGIPVLVRVRAGEMATGEEFDAKIERQVFGGVRALFKVRLKKPVPFRKIASAMGLSFVGEEFANLLKEYRRLDCLVGNPEDPDVVCMWARWADLRIPSSKLKKGMPVEVVAEGKDYPVRFIKRVGAKVGSPKVLLFWLPEPATWYDVENIADRKSIRPEYMSKDAYMLPFHGYKAMYRAGIKLPRARRRRMAGRVFMEFEEPVPIKTMVDRILRPYYHILKKRDPVRPVGDIWRTLMLSVLFHMIPVAWSKIEAVRPMREDLFYGLIVPAEEALEGL